MNTAENTTKATAPTFRDGKPGYDVLPRSWRFKDAPKDGENRVVFEIVFRVKTGPSSYVDHTESWWIVESKPETLRYFLQKVRILGWEGQNLDELAQGEHNARSPGKLHKVAHATFESTEQYGQRFRFLNESAPLAPVGAGSFLSRLSARIPDADATNAVMERERREKYGRSHGGDNAPPAASPAGTTGGDDPIPF